VRRCLCRYVLVAHDPAVAVRRPARCRKLAKLMDGATALMTVELWAIASTAGLVMKQTDETGVELDDQEMAFLKSFARLVERLCKDQYHREVARGRS